MPGTSALPKRFDDMHPKTGWHDDAALCDCLLRPAFGTKSSCPIWVGVDPSSRAGQTFDGTRAVQLRVSI